MSFFNFSRDLSKMIAIIIIGLGVAVPVWYLIGPDLGKLEITHHPKIRIDDLGLSNFNKIKNFHNECFEGPRQEDTEIFLDQHYPDYDPRVREAQAKALSQQKTVKHQDYMIGMTNAYILWHEQEPVGIFNCFPDDVIADNLMIISDVCIAKPHRGKGYGRRLMTHAIEKCATERRQVSVLIRDTEPHLIDFYKKFGFTKAEQTRDTTDMSTYFNRSLYIRKNDS